MGKKRQRPAALLIASAIPAAKTTLAPRAQYDGAGSGRRMRGWRPSSAGPNRATAGSPLLRSRVRDSSRNDWAGRAIPVRWATNLVGTGIIARPKTDDKALKALLVELWDDWLGHCDADGVLDGYGLQNMVARNWVEAGEVFVRLRYRLAADGLAVPLQIQLIESDMVPMLDSTAPNGNRIVQGIEINSIGQRVAYWMHRNHPGDGIGDTATLARITAETVLHIYEPLRPGQLRGVSDLAPIIARLRGVADFDDATLERQKIANLFAGFVEKLPDTREPALDPITGMQVVLDHSGTPMAAMEPGTMQELLPGETVKFSEPPDAGANYGEFMRNQYLGVSGGAGLPYELLTGDLRGVSDRSLRVIINEFRRHCQQRQWHILIPQFCQKVRDAWADAGVLSGAIPASAHDAARRVTWVPQGWPYIHPTQDVAAQKTAIEIGITSRTRIITERGDDPEEIDRERSEDQARALAAGLTDPLVQKLPAAPKAPAVPLPNAAQPVQPNLSAADIAAIVTGIVRAELATERKPADLNLKFEMQAPERRPITITARRADDGSMISEVREDGDK